MADADPISRPPDITCVLEAISQSSRKNVADVSLASATLGAAAEKARIMTTLAVSSKEWAAAKAAMSELDLACVRASRLISKERLYSVSDEVLTEHLRVEYGESLNAEDAVAEARRSAQRLELATEALESALSDARQIRKAAKAELDNSAVNE